MDKGIISKPTPTLLGLPEEIRLHLFEKYICDTKDNLRIRQVCHRLKNEIDHVGIRHQVNFSRSLEDPTIIAFLRNAALKNVLINGSFCSPTLLFKFEEIIHQPLKLESLLITGGFWYQFLTGTVLQKCVHIRKLELRCFLFDGAIEGLHASPSESSMHLPLLTDFALITKPYPPNSSEESITLYRRHCKIPLEFIQFMNAPRLEKFLLNIKYIASVQLDIVDLLEYSISSFILRHPLLRSVRISIEKSERGSGINLVSSNIPLRLIKSNDDEDVGAILQRLMVNSQDLSRLEEFKLHLDASIGHAKLLHLIRNRAFGLKDLGIKIKSKFQLRSELHPILLANEVSLTKIFLFCGFQPTPPANGVDIRIGSSIDFGIFARCVNLEVVSIHDEVVQHLLTTGRTLLKNLAFGVSVLGKLKALILDGFIIDATDLEEMSTFLMTSSSSDLRKDNGCSTKSQLKVLGITQATLGASVFRSRGLDQGPVMTGVTFQCFVNILCNRSLDALLLDMDSVVVTNLRDGFAVEKTREAITGQFRSLMLDLSYRDSAGGEIFPYWNTSFLGFSVNFPLL